MRKTIWMILVIQAALMGAGTTTSDRIYHSGNENKAKIDKLLAGLDMQHMISSIEIDWSDWESCGNNMAGLPGFATCFDEPAYIADYSLQAMKINSLGIDFGSDPMKNGYTRSSEEGSMHGFGWANIIKFPLMRMVIDVPGFCFEGGDLALAYMSWLDPTYDGIFSSTVFAEIDAMLNPTTIFFGAIDCAASSVEKYTDSMSSAGQATDSIRMGLPMYMGCWNSFPMGGWSHNPNPIVMGATSIGYGFAIAQRSGTIKKTMRLPSLDGSVYKDTMCGPRIEPLFVKAQYLYSLVYPKQSETVPLGAIPTEWAEFKNTTDDFDEAAFWIFQRKCFYFGAASCSK